MTKMNLVEDKSRESDEASTSANRCLQRTCEDFLSDLQLDLEKITGTVGVMAHLGNARDRGLSDGVDIDDLSNFLCLLEERLKALDKRILSVLRSEDHEHPE